MVYVWWCYPKGLGSKKKPVPAKRYAGGVRGGFPPRQRGGRNLILLAATVSYCGGVWCIYGGATQKDWVVKKTRREVFLPGKKVRRGGSRYAGGSGGVSPPAKRGQEPNPFSGRGFILWCMVVVYGGGVTQKDWVVKKKPCREVFPPLQKSMQGGVRGSFPPGREVAGT